MNQTLFPIEKAVKVITLWQPWATLWVHWIKKIETRPKPTSWTQEKGIYLIHAASKWSKEQTDICVTYPFADELLKLGYEFYKGLALGLPLGQIIGSIEVTECCPIYNPIDGVNPRYCQFVKGNPEFIQINNKEFAFGNYNNGRYAWLTQNPRVLKNPIPYKGGQGYYQNFKGDLSKLEFI